VNPHEVLTDHDSFAVVGATENRNKFGYKIYRMLKQQGKVAFPVNPRYETVDGDTCYPSIADLEEKPEVVVSVVPPEITESLIKACSAQGIGFLWLQPGTYTQATIEKAEACGITVIHGSCILIEMESGGPVEFNFPG
jgi:predicted CoA-binding protein